MSEIDRVIHEPVRLKIMSVLSGVDAADFTFMRTTLALSKGNLSSHIDKLEQAGYLKVRKSFPACEYTASPVRAKRLEAVKDPFNAGRRTNL